MENILSIKNAFNYLNQEVNYPNKSEIGMPHISFYLELDLFQPLCKNWMQ